MHRHGVRHGLLAACAYVAVTMPARATEAPLFYEVTTGLRYTDNVYLLPVDGQSGTAATVGLILRGKQESGPLQYSVDGDLDYLDYLTGHLPNETLGALSGTARYAVVPESLVWELDEHFGQLVTDPFLPPSPLNVQYVNSFNTGPDFHLRLVDAWSLRVTGRYGQDDYQTSPYDDRRLTGEAALEHNLSTVSVVGAGANRESVHYTDALEEPLDFDVDSAFVTYNTRSARTTLRLQLGYSKSTGGLSQADGFTGQLLFTRRISSRSVLTLNASRAVETAAQGALLTTVIPNPNQPVANALLTGGPVLATSFGGSWTTQWSRTTLAANASFEKDTASSVVFNERDIQNLGASLGRRLSSRTEATLFGAWSRYQLKGPTPVVEADTTIGARGTLHFTGSFLGALEISHTNRSADNGGSFRADVVWLRLGYSPRGAIVPPY